MFAVAACVCLQTLCAFSNKTKTFPAALNRCFSLNSNNSLLKDQISLNKSAWRLKGEQFGPAAILPCFQSSRASLVLAGEADGFCHRLVCLSPADVPEKY